MVRQFFTTFKDKTHNNNVSNVELKCTKIHDVSFTSSRTLSLLHSSSGRLSSGGRSFSEIPLLSSAKVTRNRECMILYLNLATRYLPLSTPRFLSFSTSFILIYSVHHLLYFLSRKKTKKN